MRPCRSDVKQNVWSPRDTTCLDLTLIWGNKCPSPFFFFFFSVAVLRMICRIPFHWAMMKPSRILSGPYAQLHGVKIHLHNRQWIDCECVPWCPITHTLLFEILCYADKSSRGSNHLSVYDERDVHISPLISEFIVFVTNPKMGSSCNTRHLIILSTMFD